YDSGRVADGSPVPDRGPRAIRRPRPRRREYDLALRESNMAGEIKGDPRTWAGRATDEHPAEISSGGVDAQDFHDGSSLTLPHRGSRSLRESRGGGCRNKDESDAEAVHVVRLQAGGHRLTVFLFDGATRAEV